jgi:rod shape-determining protein MreC
VVVRLSAARRAALQRITVPVLVLACVVLILLGKADQTVLEPVRKIAVDIAGPGLDYLSRPMAFVDAVVDRARSFAAVYRENNRLTEENERLRRWQQAALNLASENAQLRELLKLTPESSISYVTARVIASSGGAYVRSIVVNAGLDGGVARGQAAITGDGLIGRVADVGNRTARILLITDLNSRVPVILEGSRQRAVLSGDNSECPSLRYVEARNAVKIGDRLVTSGQGGVFPPGLPVGVIAGFDGDVARVEPYAELSRVEYVRIVDYGLGEDLPHALPVAGRSSKRSELSGAPTLRR